MSDEVSVMLAPADALLILSLVNQVQVQGKESMQQVLRIIHRLEAIIPVVEEDEIEEIEDED
jgi:hypothetical protein